MTKADMKHSIAVNQIMELRDLAGRGMMAKLWADEMETLDDQVVTDQGAQVAFEKLVSGCAMDRRHEILDVRDGVAQALYCVYWWYTKPDTKSFDPVMWGDLYHTDPFFRGAVDRMTRWIWDELENAKKQSP